MCMLVILVKFFTSKRSQRLIHIHKVKVHTWWMIAHWYVSMQIYKNLCVSSNSVLLLYIVTTSWTCGRLWCLFIYVAIGWSKRLKCHISNQTTEEFDYGFFIKPSVLAQSSCLGTRKFPPLNPDILGAYFSKCITWMIGVYDFTYISLKLIGYVQMKHPQVSRTILVDCINDKCKL